MRRAFRITAIVLVAFLVIVAIGVLLLLRSNYLREKVRQVVVSTLSEMVDGQVQLDAVRGGLLHDITLIGLAIREPDGTPFVAIDTLHLRYNPLQLWRKEFVFSDARIVHPVVILDQQTGERWNYERIFRLEADTTTVAPPPSKFSLRMHDASVLAGDVTVRTSWEPDSTLSNTGRQREIAQALSDSGLFVVQRSGDSYQLVQRYESLNAALSLVRLFDPSDASRFAGIDSLSMHARLFRGEAFAVRHLSGEVRMAGDSIQVSGALVRLQQSAFRATALYMRSNGGISASINADSIAGADIRRFNARIPEDLRAVFSLELQRLDGSSNYLFSPMAVVVRGARADGDLNLAVPKSGFANVSFNADLRLANFTARILRQLLPASDPGTANALDRLPRDGTFAARLTATGTQAAATVDAEVVLTDPASGESRLGISGGVGYGDAVTFRDLVLLPRPVQLALARNSLPDFPVRGALSGRATLNGTLGDSVASELSLELASDGRLSRVEGFATISGDSSPLFAVDLRADPVDFGLVAAFLPDSAPAISGYATGRLTVNGRASRLGIGMDLSILGGGSVIMNGTINADATPLQYDLTVQTEAFNAAAIMSSMRVTSINSTSLLQGSGYDPATMVASLDVSLRRSLFADAQLDSAYVRGRLASGILNVDSLLALYSGVFATATGTLGVTDSTGGTLALRVVLDSLNSLARWIPVDTTLVAPRAARIAEAYRLARADSARIAKETEVQRAISGGPPPSLNVKLPPSIRSDSIAGSALFTGALTGNYARLSLDGNLRAEGIVASGMAVDSVNATISGLLLPLDSLSARAELSAHGATVSGIAVKRVLADGSWSGMSGTVHMDVRPTDEERFEARMNVTMAPDSTIVVVSAADFRFDSVTTWRSLHPARLVLSPAAVSIDSLALDLGGKGFARISGRVAQTGADSITVDVHGMEVSHLLRATQSDMNISGRFSAGLRIFGSRDSLSFRGAAGFVDGVLANNPLPELHSTFVYDGGVLNADFFASRNMGQSFATGTARVPLKLGRASMPGVADSTISAKLSLEGVPLELVPDVTSNLSRMKGELRGELEITGTTAAPVVRGAITVNGGSALVNSVGVQVDDIVADIAIDAGKLTVNTFTARSGGPLSISGSIGLAKLSDPVFDLALTADTIYVLNNERGRLRAGSMALTMIGPMTATTVAGSVKILDGVLYVADYTEKVILPAWDPLFLAMLDTNNARSRDLYIEPNRFLDNLNVGISLEVGRDTWVRTTEANVELYSVGPLRVLMQRPGRALSMEGVLSTERGQYTFRSKRFEIRRGSATFPASAAGLNPTLQIVGEHEIQLPSSGAAHISVVIRGTMRQPEVTLESDTQPPLSQTDMMSYLAFGRSSGSLLAGASGLAPSGGGVEGVGKVAGQQLAGVALGAILTEAQREAEGAGMRSLGLDLLNISPAETYTEIAKGDVLSFLRQTEFEAGRYVTPRTFVAGQLRLSATPGVRAVHRSPGGYTISTSWEPRILLREPTLAEQRSVTKRAFSLFLSKEWRF